MRLDTAIRYTALAFLALLTVAVLYFFFGPNPGCLERARVATGLSLPDSTEVLACNRPGYPEEKMLRVPTKSISKLALEAEKIGWQPADSFARFLRSSPRPLGEHGWYLYKSWPNQDRLFIFFDTDTGILRFYY